MSGPAKRRFSLGRFALWSLGGLVVLVVLGVGLFAFDHARTSRRLRAKLEHLDATDPGWRLGDIEAARIQPADKDNSAVLCRELARLLGSNWPNFKLDEHFRNVPLCELLDADRKAVLDDEMKRLEPVRLIARRMVTLPQGRHKVEHKLNPLETLLPDQLATRKVATLFHYEMRYRANKGDVSEAVRACRACVCVGRSMVDEPSPLAALFRFVDVSVGTNGVEIALALGESNEAELVALEALLADEGRHNTLLTAVRGERAMMYLFYKRVLSGEIPLDTYLGLPGKMPRTGIETLIGDEKRLLRRRLPGLLQALTRVVENARLPSHEQAAAEAALEAEVNQSGESDPSDIASMRKIADCCRRKAARVAALRGLIAAERYRMKHGRWPTQLDDVVPEFLENVPTDPFDGKAIRMSRKTDGLVVYSVGTDGVDDGGKLHREQSPLPPGTDIGYQLWDVAKRRRPPSPPKAEEKDP
jgi:hypothetical protein